MEYYSAIKVSQYWFTLEHESHGWMNLKNCAKSKKSDQKKKKRVHSSCLHLYKIIENVNTYSDRKQISAFLGIVTVKWGTDVCGQDRIQKC